MSLYLDILNAEKQYKNKMAIYYNGHFYSYEYLIKHIDNAAFYLKNKLGLHENIVISVCLNNSLDTLIIIYALNKLGVTINMINPDLNIDQIKHFDSMINSRFFFIDKSIYKTYHNELKNHQEKLVLIDSKNSNIWSKIKLLFPLYIYKNIICFSPRNSKRKVKEEIKPITSNDLIAFTAPDENFLEKPYLITASNSQVHFAATYQSKIYESLQNNAIVLPQFNLMNLPLFISFYHACIVSNNIVSLNSINDIKSMQKLFKLEYRYAFCSDISSFEYKSDDYNHGLKLWDDKIDFYYLYNDYQESLYSKYHQKQAKQNAIVFNCYGSPMTLGVFCFRKGNMKCCDLDVHILSGYDYSLRKEGLLNKDCLILLRSNALFNGFYKAVEKNDELINKDHYLLTDFYVKLTKNKTLEYSSQNYKKESYFHNAPYIANIKDILMTIPGIKNMNITYSLKDIKTMELNIVSESKDTIKLKEDVTSYLKNQFKDNIDCEIKVEN